MGSGRRPLPFPPPTRPPPVADPHCCAPLRAGEMGPPPTVGPRGRAGHPSSPAALGHGGGVWGSQQALPRLLCQCLTSWSDTPSLVPPSPKGDHGLHFHLPPPKWGTAGQVHHSWAPTRKEGRATAVRISLDGVGGFWPGEGGVSAWGVPCGHVGDLPSAKRFPLSRSKNTKLGTPGAPQPRLPGPIPTPTPGWLSWVGGLGGGIPSHPIHLSPSRPPPCLALGKTFPTKTPHPLAWAKAIALGWASASSAPSLALLALSRYPRPGQPPPTSPETGLSSQTSPRGLANSTIRERPFPTNPPPIVQRHSRTLGPSICPQGPLHWVAVGDQSMGRSPGGQEGVGRAVGVSGSFSAGNLRVRVGGVGEGHLAAPSYLTLHGA
nr:SH3 domain-binding protein 1-like [Mirounga angustirostris]